MAEDVSGSTLRKVIAEGLSRAEQEVQISRCADEQAWTLTTSHPATARKLARIADTYGITGTYLNKYTIRFTLPLSAVSFRRKRDMEALTDGGDVDEDDLPPEEAT